MVDAVFRWYHGKISRAQAEELLSNSEEGHYLVRESNNFPGDYTLCVYSSHKVEHYHIIYKNNRLTIDEEVYFENLLKLVEVRNFSNFIITNYMFGCVCLYMFI